MSSLPQSRRASQRSDHDGPDSSAPRSFSRSSTSKISSADFIITVSPRNADLPPGLPPPSQPHSQAADSAGPASVASGCSSPTAQQQQYHATVQFPQQEASSSNSSSSGRGGPATALPDLLQPLLGPEAASAQQQQGASTAFQAPVEDLENPEAFDPFPATTAARRAAAEVARTKGAAAAAAPTENLRAALLGRAASTAAVAVAGQNAEAARFQRQLSFAYGLSWVVNILLLAAKLYAYWLSHSKAVLASAADSAVDLVSQMVISYADYKMRLEDPRFPVGQARLEAIGVLACACIMSVASFEVIQESVSVLLVTYTTGQLPQLDLGLVMYVVLGSATLLKCLCWAVCAALQGRSDSMLALAEDHLNDIMSNTGAIITAVAAGFVPKGWWIDPAGAIAISLYIVVRWLAIAKQQVDKIVGRGAPAEFVKSLEALANSHHQDMWLDVIRAYHFGARYIVEMEVVLPAEMTVKVSHDISLDLQHKVEQLDEVERAFVHVDYMRRDGLEHKVERELAIAHALSTSSSGRITPGLDGAGGSGALTSRDGGGPLSSRDAA